MIAGLARAALVFALLAAGAAAADPSWIEGDQAAALRRAKADGKPVLVYVRAEWSAWCRKLEKDVLSSPEFTKSAAAFVLLRLDAERDAQIVTKLAVDRTPATVFLSKEGTTRHTHIGYLEPSAYAALLDCVARWERENKDPDELAAAVEAALAAVPPAAVASRAADHDRTKALLDSSGLESIENEAGMFRVTVDGVEVHANVRDGVMSFQKWWDPPQGDRLALLERLLRGSCDAAIGKFGVDSQGTVWLEHHAFVEGLTGPAVAEYAKRIAKLAQIYEKGEPLAVRETDPGDRAAVGALLRSAGLDPKDDPSGAWVIHLQEDTLEVVAGKGLIAIRAKTELPKLADRAERERCLSTLASANYANYVGKFMLGPDDSLAIGWATLTEGTDSAALGRYVAETRQLLATWRAAALTPPPPAGR